MALEPNLLKCKDMMLAIGIGDAFGAGYENLYRKDIKNINMEGYQKNPHPESVLIPGHYNGKKPEATSLGTAYGKIKVAKSGQDDYRNALLNISGLKETLKEKGFNLQIKYTPGLK